MPSEAGNLKWVSNGFLSGVQTCCGHHLGQCLWSAIQYDLRFLLDFGRYSGRSPSL